MACGNMQHWQIGNDTCYHCLNEKLNKLLRILETLQKQINNIEESLVEKIEDKEDIT